MAEALRLRHRLVPYLHTMNHRAATGTPLVRPVYHLEPRRSEAFDVPHEYAFGSELLVAPITSPRSPVSQLGKVRAWLPPGTWTDIATGTVYRGDRHVDLHRDLASVPVLLRAGGLLPLAGPDELDATRNPTALEVLVAPAASGAVDLAEDPEDDDADAGGGPAATTPLRWDRESGTLTVGAVTGRAGVVPAERCWTLTFLALLPSGPVTVDGAPLEVTGHDGRWSVTVCAPSTEAVAVHVGGELLRVGPDRRDAIRELLERAQCGNPGKLAAWDVVSGDGDRAEQVAELGAVDLPDEVRAAVTELLGAVVAG
jgi:hypothetical protein